MRLKRGKGDPEVRLRLKNLKLNTYNTVKRSCLWAIFLHITPPLLFLYNCNYSMDSVLINYSSCTQCTVLTNRLKYNVVTVKGSG
jgi:hypothetical protein